MFKVGRGSEVVWGVADYWVSRVTWDPTNKEYHINGDYYSFYFQILLYKQCEVCFCIVRP